ADAPRMNQLRNRQVKRSAEFYSLRETGRLRLQIEKYELMGLLQSRVMKRQGKVIAYYRRSEKWGSYIGIVEAAGLTASTLPAALRETARYARRKGKNEMILNLPNRDPLFDAARFYGAGEAWPAYGVQVRLLDAPGLMRRLKPVFNRRLADSAFADVDAEVPFDLVPKKLLLTLKRGKVSGIKTEHEVPWQQCCRVTAESLTMLVCGRRSLEELKAERYDTICPDRFTPLVSTLFPPMIPYLHALDGF
ncbi:MAG: hypothetical protein ACTSXZ_00985, partial [Alphaproteobacteria bacterium]